MERMSQARMAGLERARGLARAVSCQRGRADPGTGEERRAHM